MKLDLSDHEASTLEDLFAESLAVERELLKENGLGTHGLPTSSEVQMRITTLETLAERLKLLMHMGTEQ